MSSSQRIYFRATILAGIGLVIPVAAIADNSTTAPAATQPIVAGRDTPAGAMNVLMQAIDRGDFATTADSWNVSPRRRGDMAYKMISQRRFYRALAARFGKEAAEKVDRECNLGVFPEHHYIPSDWEYPPREPTEVYGKHHDGVSSLMMEKGDDGIWRIGRIIHPRPLPPDRAQRITALAAAEQVKEAAWKQKFDAVIEGVKANKYPTTAAVIHALYPQGSPEEQIRAGEARQKEEEATEKRQLLAAHFDPSTVRGAIGAYMQAWMKHDAVGIAKFFYARDDMKGHLAKASAERIVSAQRLRDAVNSKFPDYHGPDISGGLESPTDAPWWADVQENAESGTAAGVFEGGQKISFRNVNGVWKEDLTTSVPSIQRAIVMEHDNQAIEHITADIISGKYKTIAEVRAALQNAHLHPPSEE